MLKSLLTATALCALALNLSGQAHAANDANDYGAVVMDPIAKKECSDCHMAFAPIKLPARSWRAIMGDLANHFGENATLDAATTKHIEAYLVSKSMDEGGTMFGKITHKKMMKKQAADYTPLRITDTSDWRGDHNGGKYKRMLADKKLKSGANCVVCHQGAPEGRYEEFDNLPD